MEINSIVLEKSAKVNKIPTNYVLSIYTWISLGLMLTGVVSGGVMKSEIMLELISSQQELFIFIFLAQMILVFGLSNIIRWLSAPKLLALVVGYSVLNGLSLTALFYMLTGESLTLIFYLLSLSFGITTIYGYVTRKNLFSFSNICFFTLLGFIFTISINIYVNSSMSFWICSILGILLFSTLMIKNVEKLKVNYECKLSERLTLYQNGAIGALIVYLNLTNLLVFFVKLFSVRK